jgi:hypothetical protein
MSAVFVVFMGQICKSWTEVSPDSLRFSLGYPGAPSSGCRLPRDKLVLHAGDPAWADLAVAAAVLIATISCVLSPDGVWACW